MSLLEIKNLKTYFYTKDGIVKAVDDVSFTLEEGEAIGIVGESGCGKTTTALSITSLLPEQGKITGGEINFNGKNLVELNQNQIRRYRWNEISIVFQGAMNALNPVKKIGEQITEVMMYHNRLDNKAARKKAKELLELVEIESSRIDQYPHEFSGGMKQRVMIAMALACDPKILIGDEPTTALDVMVQAQILELLEKLREELGMSLILITHDLSVMAETCDKAVVMYAGKIVETGTVENVINHSSHPYTQKLVKAFPDIHGEKEMTESIPGAPPDLSDPPSGCYFHPRCEHATEECKLRAPPLKKITEDHYVACHLRGEYIWTV